MKLAKAFTNPWVLAGGAIIGVIVLTSRGSGANPENSGLYIAGLQSATELNRAGMQTTVELARVASDNFKTQAEYSSRLRLALYNSLTQMASVGAMVDQQRIQSNAGITNARIASWTALTMDRQQNDTRVKLANISAGVEEMKAKLAYKTVKTQQQGAIFNNAISAGSNLAGNLAKAIL